MNMTCGWLCETPCGGQIPHHLAKRKNLKYWLRSCELDVFAEVVREKHVSGQQLSELVIRKVTLVEDAIAWHSGDKARLEKDNMKLKVGLTGIILNGTLELAEH